MPKPINTFVIRKKIASSIGSAPTIMPVDRAGSIVQVPDEIASESIKER